MQNLPNQLSLLSAGELPTDYLGSNVYDAVQQAIEDNPRSDTEMSRAIAKAYLTKLEEQANRPSGDLYRIELEIYRALASTLNLYEEAATNAFTGFIRHKLTSQPLAQALALDRFGAIMNEAERQNGGVVVSILRDATMRFKLYHGDLLEMVRSFVKGALLDTAMDKPLLDHFYEKTLNKDPWGEMLLMVMLFTKLNLSAVLHEIMLVEAAAR